MLIYNRNRPKMILESSMNAPLDAYQSIVSYNLYNV